MCVWTHIHYEGNQVPFSTWDSSSCNCSPWVTINSAPFHSQMSLGLGNKLYGYLNYKHIAYLYIYNKNMIYSAGSV